jgi:hypothetical protein
MPKVIITSNNSALVRFNHQDHNNYKSILIIITIIPTTTMATMLILTITTTVPKPIAIHHQQAQTVSWSISMGIAQLVVILMI